MSKKKKPRTLGKYEDYVLFVCFFAKEHKDSSEKVGNYVHAMRVHTCMTCMDMY